MQQYRTRRMIAGVTSLVAAYALALNVMIAGVLFAGLSPQVLAGGIEICSPSMMLDADGQRDSATPPQHCSACLIVQAIDLPPPATTWVLERVAQSIPLSIAATTAPVSHDAPASHQPRAPPIAV